MHHPSLDPVRPATSAGEDVIRRLSGGSGRPLSARRTGTPSVPQRNFLQDTACKLADDASRACSRLDASTSSPTPTLSTSMRSAAMARATPVGRLDCKDKQDAMAEVDLWRHAFHAEAQECVRSLQFVLDSANITHFASRFEDWRKVDMKATAQMQQHVKQLTRLNESVDEFLVKCATPDEFSKFKGAVVSMARSVDDLTTARSDICNNIDRIAERSAVKVVGAWESQVGVATEMLRQHTNAQTGRWAREDEQQAHLDGRLDTLNAQVEKLCVEVRHQSEQITALSATQLRFLRTHQDDSAALSSTVKESGDATRESMQQLVDDYCKEVAALIAGLREVIDSAQLDTAHAFGSAVQELNTLSRTSAEELTAALKAAAAADSDALKKYVANVLIGPKEKESHGVAESSDRPQSIGRALGCLEERLTTWEGTTLSDLRRWRESTLKLEYELKDANRDVEHTKAISEQVRAQHEVLEGRVSELQDALSVAEKALERAHAATLNEGMKALKEIEGRGRIKVNRQAGDVKLLDTIVFLPPTAENPNGSLADATVAGRVLADIADVAAIFRVPLHLEVNVKVPKNGDPAHFQALADAWGRLAKDCLESKGLLADNVASKGVAGPTVVEGIVVQFERAIFVSPAKKKR